MAKFGMSYTEAMRCTYKQFEIEMIAYRLKRQETIFYSHLDAFNALIVQATEGEGKNVRPKFKDFNDFYDNEQAFEEALRPNEITPKQNKTFSMADANRLLNKQKGG